MRWTEIDSDPNSPTVVNNRKAQLDAASQSFSGSDRRTYMQDAADGRRVLSLGCVDHDFDRRNEWWWLHGILAERAAELVGVDYDAVGVEKMRQAGHDVVLADLTDPRDVEKVAARGLFDVVVAGEVIEHIYSPQAVLEVSKTLLKDGGLLIVTTPNPYAPWRVRNGQRGITWENVDHVAYCFPSGMVEMAERAGLRLTAFGSLNITGRIPRYRSVLKQRALTVLRREELSPVRISLLDAFLMNRRKGPMMGETAVYELRKI